LGWTRTLGACETHLATFACIITQELLDDETFEIDIALRIAGEQSLRASHGADVAFVITPCGSFLQ
jgi:hypothetical protein